MATPMRVKRRAAGGASGAPASLLQSELAYSEVDQILYIGQGSGGSATVVAIAGPGSYATKAYVTSAVAAVDVSSQLSSYLTTATAASTYAPLASPSLSGVPLAPTATAGTNSTQIATTAYVTTAISNLVGGPGQLSTRCRSSAPPSATTPTSPRPLARRSAARWPRRRTCRTWRMLPRPERI
jgi:hypothetical protein